LGAGALLLLVAGVSAYLAFGLFVRRGVTPVPDIVGQERAAAEAVLTDSGLTMDASELAERHDDEIPLGRIVEQRPGAHALVKRGSAVRVIYSLGPEVAEVPDLTGQVLAAAQVSLSDAGLTLGRTVRVHQIAGEVGQVVEQDPTAGSMVGYSQPVDVYIGEASHSDLYVMPDLVYRDYDLVRSFFERRGFQLGGVKPEPYEGVPPGVILRQYPLAGHPVTRSDVVSLVVSTVPTESY
jgi:serine/threonine-protein kinase